jgi:hypothetical protein
VINEEKKLCPEAPKVSHAKKASGLTKHPSSVNTRKG